MEQKALKKTLLEKEEENTMMSLVEKTDKYKAQLEGQKKEMNTLKAALKEAEQQVETNQNHWQEDKSSLLQETEALKNSLLEKEEEWKEKESTMMSLVEKTELEGQKKEMNTLKEAELQDLKGKIQKKRKKWFRRLFSCSSVDQRLISADTLVSINQVDSLNTGLTFKV